MTTNIVTFTKKFILSQFWKQKSGIKDGKGLPLSEGSGGGLLLTSLISAGSR